MKCPKCPTYELLPARTSENDPAIDGYKCLKCDTLYRMNKSNHLVPVAFGAPKPCEVTKPEEAPAERRCAAICKDGDRCQNSGELFEYNGKLYCPYHYGKIKPADKQSPIDAPTEFLNDYHEVSDQDAVTIAQRLTIGDAPAKIASDMNFKKHQIIYLKGKLLKEGKKQGGGLRLSHRGYHRLSPTQRGEIKTRLAAGDLVSDIARDMECTTSAIYKYQERSSDTANPKVTKEAIHPDAAKLAENWLNSSIITPPTLTIRMANNGFVVTDMENDEFAYTSLHDLLQVITDFFGDPIPCNPTRTKEKS